VYLVNGGFLKLPRRRGPASRCATARQATLLRGQRYGLCVLHDFSH
jgi:hypothetical protein